MHQRRFLDTLRHSRTEINNIGLITQERLKELDEQKRTLEINTVQNGIVFGQKLNPSEE
jgi:hypothetical protein